MPSVRSIRVFAVLVSLMASPTAIGVAEPSDSGHKATASSPERPTEIEVGMYLLRIATPIQRSVEVVSGTSYRTLGVKWWGEGAYERQTIDGSQTAATTLNEVRKNDLIINKIWVRHGSVAIAGPEIDGCAGSNEFPTFALDQKKVLPRWVHWYTKTRDLWNKCDALSQGTSGKNRIRPERFLTVEIPLPPLPEQRRIVAKVEELAAKIEEARGLRASVDETVARFSVNVSAALVGNDKWPMVTALRAAATEAMGVDRPTLAIDGKTLRRSHDRRRNLGALHSVSVWASEFGLTLAQVATAEKSNEITAIPMLLSLIDIRGAIITIDAMGTQTAIAEKIIAGGGDYLLALKGNQGTLHDATIDYIHEQTKTDFRGIGARRLDTVEKKHGRIERRTYIQMPVPKSLPGFAHWKGLLSIGLAFLHCIRDGKETTDVRYFISSLPVKVKQFAHAVRSHWGIENSCHWCLDVTYREDESRIRDERLRENFAWLNRLTLSLLKQHPEKDSVAMKRRACGWNDEYMLQVLTGTSR